LSADDATVFAAAGSSVVALHAANGTRAWTGTLAGTASAAPAVSAAFVYVPTTTGDLQVFAANGCGKSTCAPLWIAHTQSSITRQPAATSGGLVYTASADGKVRAFPAAGCGTATCTAVWSAATGSTITGGPVAALGNLYIGTDDGRLVAYGP
jgi:outer membrane protein assembly factor BamB